MKIPTDKKWNESHARFVLQELGRKGLSVGEMAKQLGVTPQRIYWWKNRLQEQKAAGSNDETAFVEVSVAERPPASAMFFTVQARGGRKVEVPVGFDADELSRLLSVVEEMPC